MSLEQEHFTLSRSHKVNLDKTASAVSEVLSSNEVKHGFFGGYAVSLLGGTRMTYDVDVIVGEDAQSVRERLLEADKRFFLTAETKLVFKTGTGSNEDVNIPVELLRGGAGLPLKLPDANKAAMIKVKPSDIEESRGDREIPLIHPALITFTKLKRWMFIAESTRPASIARARNDLFDLDKLLRWLVNHGVKIDFDMYPEKTKEELLPGLQKLLKIGGQDIRDLLKAALDSEDFEALL